MVNEIIPGNMFGELGLIYDRLRAATCIALTDVEVALMDKVDYKRSLENYQKISQKVKCKYFEKFIIKEEHLKFLAVKLSIMFDRKCIQRGQSLFQEGNPSDLIYFIFSGEVALCKSWVYDIPSKFNHNHQKVNKVRTTEELVLLRKGESIGEEGFSSLKHIYQYKPICRTETVFYCIQKIKLWSLLEEDPEFYETLSTRKKAKEQMLNSIDLKLQRIQRKQNKKNIICSKIATSKLLDKKQKAQLKNLFFKKSKVPDQASKLNNMNQNGYLDGKSEDLIKNLKNNVCRYKITPNRSRSKSKGKFKKELLKYEIQSAISLVNTPKRNHRRDISVDKSPPRFSNLGRRDVRHLPLRQHLSRVGKKLEKMYIQSERQSMIENNNRSYSFVIKNTEKLHLRNRSNPQIGKNNIFNKLKQKTLRFNIEIPKNHHSSTRKLSNMNSVLIELKKL